MVKKRNGQFLRKLGLYQADTDIFDPMPPLTTPPDPVIDASDQLEDKHDGDTPDLLESQPDGEKSIPESTTPAL